eukprot:5289847-Heterocapsa_arctica.AAC.1
MRCCDTPACNTEYLAEPHWKDGYIHKHCCSSCTRTGGYEHTRRCRRNNVHKCYYRKATRPAPRSTASNWQDNGWWYPEEHWTAAQDGKAEWEPGDMQGDRAEAWNENPYDKDGKMQEDTKEKQ